MKLRYITLIFIIFLSACSTDTTQHQPNTIPAKVVKVVDGDTIKVNIDGKTESVRLLLIDTPETKHPSKPVQPFGPEASAFTKEKLEGEIIELELGISERDKYGRLLAYVWIDGEMINELLLSEGLARVAYIYEPNVKYVDEFQSIQRKAQKEGVGIWSIEDYVREDGFQGKLDKKKPGSDLENDCNIKGNINSDGEKIFHVPGGAYYEITKEEKMFCTKEEATSNGFRPSSK